MGRLFGTDGVRGIANTELTPEMAFKIGKAAAYVLTAEMAHAPNIIIGMDTRASGTMLEAALSAGICSVGAHCVSVGVIPTPGIAYLIREYNMDAGVVISASHNPMEYNGIKIFNSDGYKLLDRLEDEIEKIIFSDMEGLPKPIGSNIGAVTYNHKAVEAYSGFLLKVAGRLDLSGLKVAIDCANGATYEVAPYVLKELGADVYPIHVEPDGSNINHNCGSTHMENLCEFVKNNKMDIGIAFDGDGDRTLMVDEHGAMIDGDEIMSVCATHFKKKGMLKNNYVVATVMSNLGLFIMGEEQGINIEKTAVGDRYVLERMLEIDASIGGEQSGHIIFLDCNTTGDGILTAIKVLEIMKESGKALSELNCVMKVMPQILVNAIVKNENKYDYDKVDEINEAIAKLDKMFAGKGRVLIRASGTEPLVRVMIEGENQELLKEEAVNMAKLIEKHLGNG